MKAEYLRFSLARTFPLALAVAMVAAAMMAMLTGRAEAAAGSTFEVAAVIAEIKRQLAAAEATGAAGGAALRIDDAQLDLALVENPAGRGGTFVVPASDFVAGNKEETPRPSLRRRIIVEVQPAKTPFAPPAAAEPPAVSGRGRLTQAINDVRADVAQAIAADPAYDLKRFTIDLDFAVERDGKGALQLVLFARDRRIDPANVHGLKLRLATPPPAKDKDPRNKS